ncbi:hypothetical protein ACQ4N7_28580 [Nodosilinea sp. AN01ver1]|uniref:hypothetical protein n=1 Tax=Nodosilinea sp. AN01ver1 TaxID=3423362 RepID=UPI003D31AA8A
MHEAQPLILVEGRHQICQLLVIHPALQLPIQLIRRRLPERVAVDLVNGIDQILRFK